MGRENSRSRREISRQKKTQKRAKWKYYRKQQASGIEYLTRYTVLVLLTSMSSLMMIAVALLGLEMHIAFALDVVINSTVIYFYFIFSKWCYHSVCCLCHSWIQSLCVKLCI